MPITYQAFIKASLTLEPFGIIPGDRQSTYFCTPRQSTILGWTGVDGIHYVQIKKLGEMIFAVNPYADPGRHAHPVARNFTDLLCLLAKCGHESCLEQAHAWSREQYDAFCEKAPMTAEQNAAAEQIVTQLGLTPIPDVYAYVKELDATFDYSTIPYPADYWEYVPRESIPVQQEWRVYFSASFGERGARGEKAGEELPLAMDFDWDDRHWRIPAVYACSKGLVVDLIATVDRDRMQSYTDYRQSLGELSPAEEYRVDGESPLRDDFIPTVLINGQRSRIKRMTTLPLPGDGRELSPTDRQVLSYYGLDEQAPTLLCRMAFPWTTAKKPSLRSLQLCLTRRPSVFPGEPFTVSGEGDRITLRHPTRGTEHTLTVCTLRRCELPPEQIETTPYRLPPHSVQLLYTLTPELPDDELTVRDVRHNDAPIKQPTRKTTGDDFCSVAVVSVPRRVESEAAAIGIIGGADGPIAMIAARPPQQQPLHAASSAMTFEAQPSVTWQPSFRVHACDDTTVTLL